MREEKFYVGLDTATTTGIAVLLPDNKAAVTSVKGTPIQQLGVLGPILAAFSKRYPFVGLSMEKQHNFINANTARSLSERYGFLRWTLTGLGFTVNEVSPRPARKLLGVVTKQECFDKFVPYFKGEALTSDHTDALAVCIFSAYQDGYKIDWERFVVVNLKIEEVE